jgi:hypothetical protein
MNWKVCASPYCLILVLVISVFLGGAEKKKKKKQISIRIGRVPAETETFQPPNTSS